MGEARSNSDLFRSETTPNLCGPTRQRTQVRVGDPSLLWSPRDIYSTCTQADPEKEVARIPCHSQSGGISLPSVVGIGQTTEGDKEGDS